MFLGVLPSAHHLDNPHVAAHPYPIDSDYPTIYRIIRETDENCELASFSNWSPINTGIIEQNLNCHMESLPDSEIPSAVSSYLAYHNPKLLFIHLDGCDHAGHEFGYYTQEHYNALCKIDMQVGEILDAIEAEGMWDDSLIMILTDHGGGGDNPKDHGSPHPKDRTIFWGACGPNVRKGVLLDAPVHIVDTTAVCLNALGIEPRQNMCSRVPYGMFCADL
jgi:predicted AlkP superfamily pyrophosphatase or phosphodiesterase